MSAGVMALGAGALAVLAAADLLAGAGAVALKRAPGAMALVRSLADAFARAGTEGRDPDAVERRWLLTGAAAVAFGGGWLLMGLVSGVLAAAAAPVVGSRILRARRARYTRAVEAGAADIAIALSDALSGGHSLRGAVLASAESVAGPPGHELRQVAAQLELGAPTDEALEAMRARIGSARVDMIVAGTLLQRRAGGDLAKLLRESARSFEDEARLAGEVKAATAQARFTGFVVIALPLGGAGLAELGSPGFVANLAGSPLSAWLVGMAVAMQIGAAVAIRRLARVRA